MSVYHWNTIIHVYLEILNKEVTVDTKIICNLIYFILWRYMKAFYFKVRFRDFSIIQNTFQFFSHNISKIAKLSL